MSAVCVCVSVCCWRAVCVYNVLTRAYQTGAENLRGELQACREALAESEAEAVREIQEERRKAQEREQEREREMAEIVHGFAQQLAERDRMKGEEEEKKTAAELRKREEDPVLSLSQVKPTWLG